MMSASPNNIARTPGQWVAIATLDLAIPAREQIQVEVEVHYADAVKSPMDKGLPQAEAEAAALHVLGDPSAAANDLRQRHRTETEAKWLHAWIESAPESATTPPL
jgi:hypothetical protein